MDKTPKQEKITHKESTDDLSIQQRVLKSKTQTAQPETPQIPLKPVMSAEAAEYPRLLKIYKELNRQNGIIFNAERERNELELERDSLKGLAKLTKKGELKSRIDRKSEEIGILKVGLSGIAQSYGYQNAQKLYETYHKSYSAYADYWEQAADYQQQKTVKSKRAKGKIDFWPLLYLTIS